MKKTAIYDFNVNVQEQDQEQFYNDNVIKKITAGRVDKQDIEQSGDFYVYFMKKYDFPDNYLYLKYMIIYSALINFINPETGDELFVGVGQNKLYSNNYKTNKQVQLVRQNSSLTFMDLQTRAPYEAEYLINDAIYQYYCLNKYAKVLNFETIVDEVNVKKILTEPYGQGTHPDRGIIVDVLFKNGERIELNILVEIKSVLSEIRPDNTLRAKYSNATNCVTNVIDELKLFHDKDAFQNKENSRELFNKTKIFSTLVIFFHYLPEPQKYGISFHDFDLTWMPLSLEFDLDNKGKIGKEIIKVKSKGEKSQNNNASLSLCKPQGIYHDQNILIDRTLLFLLGHTSEYRDHLIIENDGFVDELYSKCEVMGHLFNRLVGLDKEDLPEFCNEIRERRDHIKRDRNLTSFKVCNDYRKEFINEIFAESMDFIKQIEYAIRFINMEEEINRINENIADISYTDFNSFYKDIKDEWKKIRDKENKYYNNKKDEINKILTVQFKQYQKEKKKAVNKK